MTSTTARLSVTNLDGTAVGDPKALIDALLRGDVEPDAYHIDLEPSLPTPRKGRAPESASAHIPGSDR